MGKRNGKMPLGMKATYVASKLYSDETIARKASEGTRQGETMAQIFEKIRTATNIRTREVDGRTNYYMRNENEDELISKISQELEIVEDSIEATDTEGRAMDAICKYKGKEYSVYLSSDIDVSYELQAAASVYAETADEKLVGWSQLRSNGYGMGWFDDKAYTQLKFDDSAKNVVERALPEYDDDDYGDDDDDYGYYGEDY